MTAGGTRADREAAPAKINLALHVTGRRADGYHLLDTLVIHGGAADTVSAVSLPEAPDADAVGTRLTLAVDGPLAAGLEANGDNLVLRAARAIEAEARGLDLSPPATALTLSKHLPIASGIGGGSSDAAATLRLLNRLWRLDLPLARLAEIALPLGADVPMCVWGRPLRARGIGEAIEILPALPDFALVLANPGVAVSTPAVFRALTCRDNPPLPDLPDRFVDLDALIARLGATRNDLQAAAISQAPVIAETLARLAALPGCLMARMSGSGATCFAIFRSRAAAEEAVAGARLPGWVATGEITSHPV